MRRTGRNLWRALQLALMGAGLAVALGGCEGAMFGGPQKASLTAPPKPRQPEERGIWIVGSRSVEPRLRAASAGYDPSAADVRPRVVADGTAAGLRRLCAGTGVESPDMALADRPIAAAEIRRCAAKGITLSEYALGPKQYVYVKDAHMMAIPGVRDFVDSWGVSGKPVSAPTTPS